MWFRYKPAEWNNKFAPQRFRTRCVEKFETPPYDRLCDLGLFNDLVSAVAWRRKRRQCDREWGVDKISKKEVDMKIEHKDP